MNVFRPVALIPVYNHHQVIDELLDVLGSLDLPVILVDDGSNEPVRWTSQPHRIGRQVSCALQKTAAKGRR